MLGVATNTENSPDLRRPLFIGNEIYRRANFGPKHPLSVPRVPGTIDLVRALGWLPDAVYFQSSQASLLDILRFHDAGYVAALQRGERDNALPAEHRHRHNLGKLENPIHDTMYSRPATSAGAMLAAAGATVEDVVHMNIYITDMEEYRRVVKLTERDVLHDCFPPGKRPAGVAVGVTSLVDPSAMIEIEATAIVD